MTNSYILYTIAFIVYSMVPHGQSLKCYTHQSTPVESCLDDLDVSSVAAEMTECPPGVAQCYSHTKSLGDCLIYLSSGCRAEDETEGCRERSGQVTCNYYCDSDLCNNQLDNTTLTTDEPDEPTTLPSPTTETTPEKYSVMCYSCGNTDACIYNVGTQTAISCNITAPDGRQRGCYVYRRTNNADGAIHDFQRSCEVLEALTPSYGCVPDHVQTTCITTCTTDLCNTGDGTPTPPPPPPPGQPNSATTASTLSAALIWGVLWYSLL